MDLRKFLQMPQRAAYILLSVASSLTNGRLFSAASYSITTHFGGASGDVIRLFQDYLPQSRRIRRRLGTSS
jgi:hypothetical protein